MIVTNIEQAAAQDFDYIICGAQRDLSSKYED
jgi:hypothetical protein